MIEWQRKGRTTHKLSMGLSIRFMMEGRWSPRQPRNLLPQTDAAGVQVLLYQAAGSVRPGEASTAPVTSSGFDPCLHTTSDFWLMRPAGHGPLGDLRTATKSGRAPSSTQEKARPLGRYPLRKHAIRAVTLAVVSL